MKKLLLILSILFLSGCDYKELTDMSIVSLIAIDKTDKYRVIVEVINYKNNNVNTITYENEDITLDTALNGISLKSPKKLYLSHLKNIIVSERLAKDDITSIFDYLLRDSKIEKDFNLVITKDIDNIKELIEKQDEIPSENLSSKLNISEIYNGKITKVTFDTFVSNTLKEGIEPVLPVINIKDNNIILEPYIGIFKNNKLVGYLDEDATIGYNLLNKNINNIITFKCNNDEYASIELNYLNKKNMYFDINTNTLVIDIDLSGTLTEINCNINLDNNDDINNLNNKFNNKIKDIINKTIYYEKEYNSDFLGIISNIKENNYSYYKNIDNDKLINNFNTKINIKTSWISNGSLKKGDEKY